MEKTKCLTFTCSWLKVCCPVPFSLSLVGCNSLPSNPPYSSSPIKWAPSGLFYEYFVVMMCYVILPIGCQLLCLQWRSNLHFRTQFVPHTLCFIYISLLSSPHPHVLFFYLLHYCPRFSSISEIASHLQVFRITAMRATFLAHTILLGLIMLLVHFCWIRCTL